MEKHEDVGIGVCLSGGGLRATYFHLGLLIAMREHDLLPRITEIYSVSGGSITAAHLLQNWKKYTGSDDEFAEAIQDLRDIAKRDIRGRILRRYALSWALVIPRLFGINRTWLLEREYKSIFGSETIKDLSQAAQSRSHDGTLRPAPRLYVLATSFNTGALCSFNSETFNIEDNGPPISVPGDAVPLAFALTASSAFPPMFRPVRIDARRLSSLPGALPHAHALTDGGVFDNLGFRKYVLLKDNDATLADTVIVSDGSGAFERDTTGAYWNIVSRTVRTTSILMKRLADETLRDLSDDDMILVSISNSDCHDDRLPTSVQSHIPSIRTDLNAFSRDEVDLLISHGYRAALKPLANLKPRRSGTSFEPDITINTDEHWRRVVRRATARSFWPLALNDWATYAILGLGVAFGAALYKGGEFLDDVRQRFEGQARLIERQETQITARAPVEPVPDAPRAASIDKARYRVFIQFAGFARPDIVALAQRLSQTWTKIQDPARGGERLGAAAGLREVRFGDRDAQAAAEELARDIERDLRATRRTGWQMNVRYVPIIPADVLEVWISP